ALEGLGALLEGQDAAEGAKGLGTVVLAVVGGLGGAGDALDDVDDGTGEAESEAVLFDEGAPLAFVGVLAGVDLGGFAVDVYVALGGGDAAAVLLVVVAGVDGDIAREAGDLAAGLGLAGACLFLLGVFGTEVEGGGVVVEALDGLG